MPSDSTEWQCYLLIWKNPRLACFFTPPLPLQFRRALSHAFEMCILRHIKKERQKDRQDEKTTQNKNKRNAFVKIQNKRYK
jgi:hypothetical protein